jgi:hypothetical protein
MGELSFSLKKELIKGIKQKLEVLPLGDKEQPNINIDSFTMHSLPEDFMSSGDYLERLISRLFPSRDDESIVLVVLMWSYIQQFCKSQQAQLTKYNSHRLLLIGLFTADKFFCDKHYRITVWGNVGGLPVNEITELEHKFLMGIKFNLNLSLDDFEQIAAELIFPENLNKWLRVQKQKNPVCPLLFFGSKRERTTNLTSLAQSVQTNSVEEREEPETPAAKRTRFV